MRCWLGSLLALVLPAAAGAADLKLNASGGMEYNSQANLGQSEQGSDFGFRLSPTLVLTESAPRGSLHLLYQPSYVQYVKTPRDNEVDQLGSLALDYALGPLTQLSLESRVTWFRNFIFETFQAFDPSGNPVTVAGSNLISERVLRNDSSIQLQHRFSERVTGSSSFSFSLFDPEAQNLAESLSGVTESDLAYRLDADTSISGGGALTYQSFQQVDTPPIQPASQTYTYEVFGGVSRRFARIWSFSLRGGPALIVTRQEGILILPSSTDQRWTFFGQGRLAARWSDTASSSIYYRRSQSDSFGLGGASIRDTVGFSTSWQPAELWTLDLLTQWQQRQRASGNTRNFDETDWSASGSASRKLSRRTSLALRFNFNRQETTQTFQSSDLNQFLAFLDFHYDFDRIRLWN